MRILATFFLFSLLYYLSKVLGFWLYAFNSELTPVVPDLCRLEFRPSDYTDY
jgi:hypothetical protein